MCRVFVIVNYAQLGERVTASVFIKLVTIMSDVAENFWLEGCSSMQFRRLHISRPIVQGHGNGTSSRHDSKCAYQDR